MVIGVFIEWMRVFYIDYLLKQTAQKAIKYSIKNHLIFCYKFYKEKAQYKSL